MIKLLLESWLAALVVFTRLPVGRQLSERSFSYAVWHLPLLAWFYGGLQALLLSWLPWPPGSGLSLAILLILPLFVSGALHEDGLSDFCDGMLGSRDRERRLEIMKDPRLGSFGVLALVGTLGFQFLSLQSIAIGQVVSALILSQVTARGLAVSLVARLSYVQRAASRAGDYIPPHPPLWGLLYSGGAVVASFWVLPSVWHVLFFSLGLWLWHELWVFGLRRALGGYTGDCLGAAVKLSEVLILILASCMWPHL